MTSPGGPRGRPEREDMGGRSARQMLRMIQRRIDHLTRRIEGDDGKRDLSYDRMERAALIWAISQLMPLHGVTRLDLDSRPTVTRAGQGGAGDA